MKITMQSTNLPRTIDMPNDKGLTIREAEFRAKCYKKRNPSATFYIVDESNGRVFGCE